MRTRQVIMPRRYSRMGIGGDGSTLNLNFAAMGALDSRFTFTRSTTATYINSSGYVATMAAAATNDPTKARFDYDPTTLAAKGLLIEGSATNYLLRSTTCAGTGWSTGGTTTVTTSYATGPDGVANSATRFQMNYNGGTGRIYQDSGFTTKPYTNSVWIKSNTGSNQTLNLWNTAGTGNTFTITATSTWQRFQNVNTTGTSLAGYFYLENPSTNPAVVVDVLVYGAQLEAGTGASSYIPTVASQVTRAIDSCTFALTPANISLGSAPPATICYSAIVNAIPTSSFPTVIGFQDSGGTTQVFRSQINSTTSNYVTWLPTGAAINQANEITFTTLAQGISFKIATSITSTSVTASRNGVAATSVSVGATYSFGTPNKIAIGILASNVAFTIANFKFFPSAKSQAELNALST